MSDSQLIKKSFTGRSDQKTLLESMLKIAKLRNPQYNDLTENDMLYVILEAVSYAVSGLNYSSDKNYLGLNPKTADTESAKANIISSYGGSLDFFRGSYGYAKAYLKPDYEQYSIISKYTVVKDENDVKYYVYKDTMIGGTGNIITEKESGKKYILIPIRQGDVKVMEFDKTSVIDDRLLIEEKDTESSGAAYESFTIENQGVWKQVDDVFFEYANTTTGGNQAKLYSISKELDRMPVIQFITNWKDTLNIYQNDNFKITYCVTKGEGNVLAENQNLKIDNPNIESAVSYQTVKGGYTPSYDLKIQMNQAIQESRTMWTAITIEDFQILSRENPDVMASKVYDIDNDKMSSAIGKYLKDIGEEPLKPWQILVSFVGYDGDIPNSFLVKEVMDLLNDRKINVFTLRYIEPTIVNINYDVKIQTIGDSIVVELSEVEKIINRLYQNVERFGQLPVADSKIVAQIQNISDSIYSVSVNRSETDIIGPFSFSKLGKISLELEVI